MRSYSPPALALIGVGALFTTALCAFVLQLVFRLPETPTMFSPVTPALVLLFFSLFFILDAFLLAPAVSRSVVIGSVLFAITAGFSLFVGARADLPQTQIILLLKGSIPILFTAGAYVLLRTLYKY